jgi:LysR family transcriptional activator of glutamate synthase operon
MELLQLRYFATVARMENISHAAAYHMIPQPAMSKTISKLERELGAALFDRTKNRISLTPEGEILFQGVQAALLHLDNALEAVQEEKKSTSLKGTVKCLLLQHRYNMVDCIAAFKRLNPEVRFLLYQNPKEATDYDFCISAFPPTEREDLCVPVLEEELKIAVSQSNPLSGKKSAALPELTKENFLFLSPASSLCRILTMHCEQQGLHPKSVTYIDDLRCLENMLPATLGSRSFPRSHGASCRFRVRFCCRWTRKTSGERRSCSATACGR